MNLRQFVCAAALATGLLPAAQSQSATFTWPARTITWIVGFAPGGTADVLTRLAAEGLAQRTGYTVLVENRPGASGAIALQQAARGSAGEPVLITVPGPLLYPSPQPTIGAGLAPVGLMAEGPMVVVGPRGGPADMRAVLEAARNAPESWSYASSGTGTSQHLAGELINLQAGTRMLHVPYKGGGQAVTDVVGAQIPLAILGPTPVMPHIRSGALTAYAVTTAYRLDSLPETPTLREAGLPDYDASQWFAVAASPNVKADTAAQLNALLAEVYRAPAFQQALEFAGMRAGQGSAQDLVEFVRSDTERWDRVATEVGLELQ
ncbi:tripartite tricarboxylate transporter substrate binding protein [Verticiella sediminum]|uniref:Tripartite tricarboxylate transporter substrate binding protein n=1 Tax=Verticiella sediminum TaxID=1247510 RepID=A0A556AIM4_9BURK|nr:tripartite tricarboxylate transporter substrate binding protein [Verticiella sediminum]TSH92715.1 tripartite tricarboxylate transporter substrate binding protein [Verticiella sediminum]